MDEHAKCEQHKDEVHETHCGPPEHYNGDPNDKNPYLYSTFQKNQ